MMQTLCRQFNVSSTLHKQWLHASSQIIWQLPSLHSCPFLVPYSQLPAHQRLRAISITAGALGPETDVEAAVAAALAATGRTLGPTEAQLVQRLKDNLYHTAQDVAAMSQEELDVLNVPLKLVVILRNQLRKQQDVQQALQQEASTFNTDAELSAAGSAVQMPADIMQRRMPKSCEQQQQSRGESKVAVRSAPLQSLERYGLQEAVMPPQLCAELAELERFCTTRFFGQLVEPLQPVTFRTVTKHYVKLLLGFAHNVLGVPLEQLSLRTLVPSPDRDGVSLLMEYQHWRQQQRGTAVSSATVAIKAVTHVARFLYHDLAKPCSTTKQKPYHDLAVVQELNAMQRAATKAASKAARVADDSKKWLEWPDYLQMVSALRAECAGLTAAGQPRSRREVAASLQRYLIVAILSVVPDRQRTLRELEVGRTLLQQQDGSWVIKHAAGDYKTGKQYGDRPPLPIAPFIHPELEAFINTWRQELAPKTNKLFCRPRSGDQLDENAVYYTFRQAALRLTGKATHPHLVRDMIVTHLRTQQRSESEMEALALYMGHSVAMQRSHYDRRSMNQKVAPAQQLLQQLAKRGRSTDS